MSPFCPTLGPQEGRGHVATSDFVPIVGGPPRRTVYTKANYPYPVEREKRSH